MAEDQNKEEGKESTDPQPEKAKETPKLDDVLDRLLRQKPSENPEGDDDSVH